MEKELRSLADIIIENDKLKKENEELKEELRKERFEGRLFKMLYEGPIEED